MCASKRLSVSFGLGDRATGTGFCVLLAFVQGRQPPRHFPDCGHYHCGHQHGHSCWLSFFIYSELMPKAVGIVSLVPDSAL